MTGLEKYIFMLKKWSFYTGIAVIVGFFSTAFKPISSENHPWFYLDENSEHVYQFPSEKPDDYLNTKLPFTAKYFIGFKEAIGFKESQGKYKLVNSLGYIGKYQFGKSTLKALGISDSLTFINSPSLQEQAFVALVAYNKWELRNEIKEYRGKIIGGIRVTESGILAAAHLGGAGSIRKYLKSNGTRKIKDAYGSSVRSYLRDFAGYETQNIKAKSSPRI